MLKWFLLYELSALVSWLIIFALTYYVTVKVVGMSSKQFWEYIGSQSHIKEAIKWVVYMIFWPIEFAAALSSLGHTVYVMRKS